MARKSVALVLILAFVWLPLAKASVGSGEAMYVGGTIAGLPEATMGRLRSEEHTSELHHSDRSRMPSSA